MEALIIAYNPSLRRFSWKVGLNYDRIVIDIIKYNELTYLEMTDMK